MDKTPRGGWLVVDGARVGQVYPMTEPVCVGVEAVLTPAELRAIADFLDQLAGADLLSSVVEG
jgi:hypothetical protein